MCGNRSVLIQVPDLPIFSNLNFEGAMGKRDWPLRFWSRERLFSVEARRGFLPPDLAAMP